MKVMNDEMLLGDREMNYEWVEVNGEMLLRMKLGSTCGEIFLLIKPFLNQESVK